MTKNCLVTLTAFTEKKKKKKKKKKQFNGPEQFLLHFIVASGTWTTNLPVYRLSPLLGGHICPMPQVEFIEKKKVPLCDGVLGH